MDVLVLGGSVFLGRAVAGEALARGANVTVFNRGKSGAPPDGAVQIVGDRTKAADLEQLARRQFDIVVDTSGYVPHDVSMSAAILAPTSGHYAFVSTVNVFPGWPVEADYTVGGAHHGDPDATAAPDDLSEAGRYGWLKAGCEQAVVRAFGAERSSVLRGGCIVGPHDRETGRLPWWIARVARGGEVLVPGSPADSMALIDARDLAQFALLPARGTYEAAGPTGRDSRGTLMDACREVTGSDAAFTYVDADWLAGKDVQAWTEIPLWAPGAPGLFAHHVEQAASAGLTWRPLHDTVADTWAWQQSVPGGWGPSDDTPGLSADREAALLAEWHASAT